MTTTPAVAPLSATEPQRFNNRAGLMNPEPWGLYVRYEDHASLIAQARAAQLVPMYQAQFDGEYGSSVWRDVTEAAYHTFMPEHRRIVYAAPQSQVATCTAGVELGPQISAVIMSAVTPETPDDILDALTAACGRVRGKLAQQAEAHPAPAGDAEDAALTEIFAGIDEAQRMNRYNESSFQIGARVARLKCLADKYRAAMSSSQKEDE